MAGEPGISEFERGFPVEDPPVTLEWGIAEDAALGLLAGARVQRVVAGQVRLRCKALGGLDIEVNLHFKPRTSGRLKHLEMVRSPTRRRRKAFDDLQERLVSRLGAGVESKAGLFVPVEGITPRSWVCGLVDVTHDYYFQGALCEKVVFDWRG